MSIEINQSNSYELAPHPEDNQALRVMVSMILLQRLKDPENNNFDRFMSEYVHNPLVDGEPEVSLRGSDGKTRDYSRKLFTAAADGMVFHGRMTQDTDTPESDRAVVVVADIFGRQPPSIHHIRDFKEYSEVLEVAFKIPVQDSGKTSLGLPLHYKLRFNGHYGELIRGIHEQHVTPLADIEELNRQINTRQEQVRQAGAHVAKEVIEPSLIEV